MATRTPPNGDHPAGDPGGTHTTAPDAEPARTGRPTKLTPDLTEKLCTALRAFNHMDTAARLTGIHPSTVYRWLAEAEPDDAPEELREFREAVTRARAEAEVRIVAGVAKAALGGVLVRRVTRTLRDGTTETEEQYTAPDGRVGLEFLARAYPDRWARRQAIEVTGADGGPIQVEQQSAIADLAARLCASLAAGDGDDGSGEEGVRVVPGELVDEG